MSTIDWEAVLRVGKAMPEPQQSASEASYTSYARATIARGDRMVIAHVDGQGQDSVVADIARWAGGCIRSLGSAQSVDCVFGLSPDYTKVRIAKVLDSARTALVFCDLLPTQAACGVLLQHAVDRMLDRAAIGVESGQVQVDMPSGELWKFTLCTMVQNGQQSGFFSGDRIRVQSRFDQGGVAQTRTCVFSIAALDTGGLDYAAPRFKRAQMPYTLGSFYQPSAALEPITLDLEATDRAFEGF